MRIASGKGHMSGAGTFTVVNDKTLCDAVRATLQTLVYVAPGITKPVVDAIGESLRTKPHLLVTAIIDLDPEVYRLGFGTEEGLKALQDLAGQQHFAFAAAGRAAGGAAGHR